jgi:acyl carrier protein
METKIWLQQKISEEAGIPAEEIKFDDPFEKFSMDSLSVITLAYELEGYTGKEQIDPTVFAEYNTINKLSEWLAGQQ